MSGQQPRQISESASVLGIPQIELTPKVQGAIMLLMEEMQALRGELGQSRARIEYLERLADQDSLAPAANRREFVRELARVISFNERYNAPSSIIYFDVNGMKTTNDTYAHSAGDASLMRVADVLLEIVRVSAIIGRLGEDEFAVILPQGDRETALEKPTAWPRSSNPSRWTGMAYPFRYI